MENTIVCPTCKTNYETEPETCPKCGFPFSGTEKEKSLFIGQQILKKGKVKDTKDVIKRARIILWVIGGLNLLISPIYYGGEPVLVIIGLITGVLFIGFGLLASVKPFISILIPLILLILAYTTSAIINPDQFYRGILWKFVFVGVLVYALVSILEAEKLKKESSFMKEQDYK